MRLTVRSLGDSTAENVLGLEVITADGARRTLGPRGVGVGSGDASLGPHLEASLRELVDGNLVMLRRKLPPWSRRVSGYALDWLLPERGFDVARSSAAKAPAQWCRP